MSTAKVHVELRVSLSSQASPSSATLLAVSLSKSCCVTQVNDAYTVLLREKKLPMALLEDPEAKAAAAGKAARASLVQTQPFAATFGVKHIRKRPKLAADSLADLVSTADRINATCALLVCQQHILCLCL